MEQQQEVTKRKLSINTVLSYVLNIALTLALGAIIVVKPEIFSSKAPTPSISATPTPSEVVMTSDTPTPTTTTEVPPVNGQTQNVQIGNVKVTLPAGWYISFSQTKVRNLSNEEKSTLLKGTAADQSDVMVPVNDKSTVQISNGVSTLTFEQPRSIIYGGIGFVPEEISSSATIIVTPTNNKNGFVVEKVGTNYAFKDIFACKGAAGDPCRKYGYQLGIALVRTTFSGNSADLKVMQQFYGSQILNKDLSL
jgi:hypothetical protein